MTPSAISQRIRTLEERVGCALVVREQPCHATETGRRLCQHVDQVRLMEQELEGAVPALAPEGLARVPLPIAVNADSLDTWFAPAVAAFAADAPVLVQVSVDDQDYTTEWLRSGAVMAAVTGTPRPAAGCNSQPLGSMRYLAAASPAFRKRHFADGVGVRNLSRAPSMVFNAKDEWQAQWARRLCNRPVELPRHTLSSSQSFVTASLAGMGWAMHTQALIEPYLVNGSLVELVPQAPLDVPLYWQQARAASSLLDALRLQLLAAARAALLPQ